MTVHEAADASLPATTIRAGDMREVQRNNRRGLFERCQSMAAFVAPEPEEQSAAALEIYRLALAIGRRNYGPAVFGDEP